MPVASNRGIRVIPVRGSTEGNGHRLDPSRLETFRVTSNVEIAPAIYRLSFPRTWDFVPGQSIALTLDPRVPARFYSIASGTGDPLVDVLYDLVPEGVLTPRLAALRPGDEILSSRPFGAFRDAAGPSCWIATGTGIAPFLSMARSGSTDGKLLVHGSRSIAGLVQREWFSSLLDGRYVPCCTREKGEGVFAGRPTAWLSEKPIPSAERFLLCGNSGMVVDARDILIGRGVKFADVIAEIYF
jgi:ferredoxin--NADP+ reductase